ncbi:MAG: carboxypeptidase-like regulatory domain-containing protein [Chloroflexi bacterium]|nr:carboxypeptidase-like regulatory domain-containing protein [Chloroflexota bacterium]
MTRCLTKTLVALQVAAICIAACGCIGTSGATDGGIPLGTPRGTLTGVVVEAMSPTTPVAGATLSLFAADNSDYEAVTGSDGFYSFPELPVGSATLVVTPDSRSGLASQRVTLMISPDSTKSIVIALAPASAYQAATGITLASRLMVLQVGQTALVPAQVFGGGLEPGVLPSLVVSGGVGQVFPSRQFTATHRGSGVITAFFGRRSAAMTVVVR